MAVTLILTMVMAVAMTAMTFLAPKYRGRAPSDDRQLFHFPLLSCATPSLRSKWDVSIGPKIVGNSVSGLSQSCQSKLKSLFAGWPLDMTRGTATSTLDLSKGKTCKCSLTRKYPQYALRFCLKIFFYIALENSVTEISDYKTIQVLRLLNGCKEEVRNRFKSFKSLAKLQTYITSSKMSKSKTESKSWGGAKNGENLIGENNLSDWNFAQHLPVKMASKLQCHSSLHQMHPPALLACLYLSQPITMQPSIEKDKWTSIRRAKTSIKQIKYAQQIEVKHWE